MTDPTTYRGQWELRRLLEESIDPSLLDARFETCHHTWHVCRLHNPDFCRPMVFRVGIQRPDCFTVYPSEGLIAPGESVFITFGVRTLGSALAYAFEGLNALRDGMPVGWTDLYTEEAHLPLVPFVVRYHFVPIPPVRMGLELGDTNFHTRSVDETETEMVAESTSTEDLLQFYRNQNVPAHQMNTIRLSGHVNAHYYFGHFLKATYRHWSSLANPRHGPRYMSPVLHECHLPLWHHIEDVGGSTTILDDDIRSALGVENAHLLLRMAVNGTLVGNHQEIATLLYVCTCRLQHCKASPWRNADQLAELVHLEALFDILYCQIEVGGEQWSPWRLSGCYRSSVCTNSVFVSDGLTAETEDLSSALEFKEEPDFLDCFRHLTHGPGLYCLGPQEDTNHLGETSVTKSSRYGRSQVGCVTDMFMDNPVYALQAGVCMVRDPRSLLVHGVYDWIPYPGSVVCRPNLSGRSDDVRTGSLGGSKWLRPELAVFWLQESLDMLDYFRENSLQVFGSEGEYPISYSLLCYLRGIPRPGQGRFAVCSENEHGDVVPLFLAAAAATPSGGHQTTTEPRMIFEEPRLPLFPDHNDNRPPRFLQLLWMLGAQVGLTITEEDNGTAVFVERHILVASQWVSISLMAAPLLYTLIGRCCQWIPTEPIEYQLQDPVTAIKDMRFLSGEECGFVSASVLVLWITLGRWAERYTYRDMLRVMMEYESPARGFLHRLLTRYRRLWDAICPLFVQRRVFAPHWNRKSISDLHHTVAAVRSTNLVDRQDATRASAIRPPEDSIFGDQRDEALLIIDEHGSSQKVVIGLTVALGSFCSSTPHFWLNFVTIFSCSISLGMSVSLHSLEKGKLAHASISGSWLKQFNVVTIVILGFLVGQLVGSSGGTMFLAEFVVTSVSLLLGGAGTISASAIESWGCFLCLSSSAFWGYLFGRVALIDGVRQRRMCHSTLLLSRAITFLVLFWIGLLFFARWDTPADVLIVRPSTSQDRSFFDEAHVMRSLQ